jgi:hypothetical protein
MRYPKGPNNVVTRLLRREKRPLTEVCQKVGMQSVHHQVASEDCCNCAILCPLSLPDILDEQPESQTVVQQHA